MRNWLLPWPPLPFCCPHSHPPPVPHYLHEQPNYNFALPKSTNPQTTLLSLPLRSGTRTRPQPILVCLERHLGLEFGLGVWPASSIKPDNREQRPWILSGHTTVPPRPFFNTRLFPSPSVPAVALTRPSLPFTISLPRTPQSLTRPFPWI